MIMHSHRERALIKSWMENGEHAQLNNGFKWAQLKGKMEAGEVPVVGWSQLEATIKIPNKEALTRELKANAEQNARERQELAEQIRNLLEKLQILESRNQQIQEKMKKQQELELLGAKSRLIAILCKKEEAALSKLTKKIENPKFMEQLDSDDVSTVFSVFNMDSLFSRFKKNDVDNNLEVLANSTVVDLQRTLELEFSEAVELLWKLKLLEKGEMGEARHLSKCSICSSNNPGDLLREYGMHEEDRKEIEGEMKDWKGYFFATATAMNAAGELKLKASLRQKLAPCWMRIQRAHKWEHPED